MVTITFTPRHVELVRRFLISTSYEFQSFSTNDLQQYYDSDYDRYDTTFGDFTVKIQCSLDEDGEFVEEAEVLLFCKNTIFLQMPFYYFQTKELFLYDVIQEVYKNENRTFRVCKLEYCENLCFCKEEDMCKKDFIYHYIRDDHCPICLENGGRWTKLSCSHFIHTTCVKKLHKESCGSIICPLCKQVSSYKNAQHNYLFLQ